MVARHHALQRRLVAVQADQQFQLASRGAAYQRLQPVERDEEEALRQGEVLPQQPEAGEAARRRRQQGLVLGEADPGHATVERERHRLRPAGPPAEAGRMARQRLVQQVRDTVASGQVQHQPVQHEAGEG